MSFRHVAVVLSTVSVLCGCGEATRDDASAAKSSATSLKSPGLTEPPDKPVGGTVEPPRRPIPVKPGDPFAPTVVWRGDMLIVTAFGSSTCPPVATGAAIIEAQLLLISFADPPEQACTDDYGAARSRIDAPEGDIDLRRDLRATYALEGSQRWLIDVRLRRPQR